MDDDIQKSEQDVEEKEQKKRRKKQKVYHDPQKAFEKSVHHIVEKARNSFILDETFPNLRKNYKATNRDFNKAKEFVVQRATRGWADRDTWNIDHWFSRIMHDMLAHFAKTTIGYQQNAVDLYNQCKAVDFEDAPVPEPRKDDESIDDYTFRVYKFIIDRMSFLFGEYDEETCTVKNEEKYIMKSHSESVPGKGYSTWVDDCNEEEKAQNRKWMDRENEVENYRVDCLHKAIKMLDIMIVGLWD